MSRTLFIGCSHSMGYRGVLTDKNNEESSQPNTWGPNNYAEFYSKNNNKTQTFIQGLRPFSSSIPKTLKKHIRKGGYNYSNIIDNWTKMVSKKISNSCYPIAVKIGKEMRNGTLVLNVSHGKEMEIEYEKNEIIEIKNNYGNELKFKDRLICFILKK